MQIRLVILRVIRVCVGIRRPPIPPRTPKLGSGQPSAIPSEKQLRASARALRVLLAVDENDAPLFDKVVREMACCRECVGLTVGVLAEWLIVQLEERYPDWRDSCAAELEEQLVAAT